MAFFRKKLKFTPNKNTALVVLILLTIIWLIMGIRALTRYDRSLRGAAYEDAPVYLPEYKVRALVNASGEPTADYFEIYPPSEDEKVIYLTFDDGPSTKITPKILDILKRYHVRATFFVVGKNAEKNPEIIKRIAKEGHSVASHSYTHDYDVLYADPETFRSEIKTARQALLNIVGEKYYTDIFRFPGGAFRNERAEMKNVLIEENIPFVNWNALTGDAETQNPAPYDLIMRAKRTAKDANSVVLLMHDAPLKQATVDALPTIIEYFKDKGYRFLPLHRY